jgi:hypothetical protein
MERVKQDLLSAECICPAPMMSEIDRQRRVAEKRKSIYANRCVVEKEWRVRNPIFDKKGEKSTTMFRIRPARTIDELEFIVKELGLTVEDNRK